MLIDTKADVKSDLRGKNFNFELNGKTFKALFSDIYTDKIGSVVVLTENAPFKTNCKT